MYGRFHPAIHAALAAFLVQHGDDVLAAVVAKQLAQLLLVVADAVALDHGDEVLRRVLRQRGAAEIGVGRQVAVEAGIDVGEVATPSAGDADLLRQLGRVVQQQHAAAALAGRRRAHQAGRAGPDYNNIKLQKLILIILVNY